MIIDRLWMACVVSVAIGCAPNDQGGAGDVVRVPPLDSGAAPDMSVDAELEPDSATEPVGVPILGAGGHTIADVRITVIGTAVDGLDVPRDLAFDPWSAQPQLWVVNRADDSTTTFYDPGTEEQSALHLVDPYALHFMEEVSSIAFGEKGTFGTCQESRNTYNDQAEANDFMGPALWSSDLAIYAHSNPDAIDALGFDLGSHLDMLHESPLCMGIAWERDNIYWVFEGLTGSIAQVDFREDHGPGFDDHSDGVMNRFASGEVARVPDVPSHLVFDAGSEQLYIADTGNGRVGVLDTRVGQPGFPLPVVEPGTQLRRIQGGAPVETLFADAELVYPSGLALHDGLLYVGDNATGRIWAVGLDGEPVDYLDTEIPRGGLMGLTFGPDGHLWVADAAADRVLRISPLGE